MSSKIDTTGTVIKVSKNSCVVSVSIDDETKSFSFIKTIFYTCGLRCEGDLSNLFDNGTTLDLCYRLRLGGKAEIVAVWLGDRPDIAEDEGSCLKPVYDQKGILTDVLPQYFIVESDCGEVAVFKEDVFRDGERFATITTDDELWFDATPSPDDRLFGETYVATCAWMGQKPKLVDRFAGTDDVMQCGREIVSGTVAVIPSEVVAFVDVQLKSVLIKVMVFRCSFDHVCDRIQDVVDVGDQLCMRIGYCCLFPGRKHWFAQVAVKPSDELISSDLLDEVGDSLFETVEDASGNADVFPREASEEIAVETSTGPVQPARKEAADSTAQADEDSSTVQFDKDSKILYCDHPPLEGVISKFTDDGLVITFGNLKIFLDRSNLYLGTKREMEKKSCVKKKDIVKFEAVLMNRKGEKYSKFSHEATCAWLGLKKPVIPIVEMRLPAPDFTLLDENNQIFYGIVTKIYFPGVALAEIPELKTTVKLRVNEFIRPTKHRFRKGMSSSVVNLISSFVQLNDCVQFKVRKVEQCPQSLCAYDIKLVECPEEIYEEVYSGRLSRVPLGDCVMLEQKTRRQKKKKEKKKKKKKCKTC